MVWTVPSPWRRHPEGLCAVGATRPVSTPSEVTPGLARDCHADLPAKGSPTLSGVILAVSGQALLFEVRCSANCARGPSSSDCSGRRGRWRAAVPVPLTLGPRRRGPVCSPTSPTARQSPSSSGPGLHPFKVATRVRIPLGARSTAWSTIPGPVAQLVSAPPCHGGGRGFESRRGR